jgi:Sel1 repeat
VQMIQSANRVGLTGLKRSLGRVTFIMVPLTLSFWLLAVPLCSLQSGAQTTAQTPLDKPIHDAFEAANTIPVSCEVEDGMVSADVCRFFINALYVKLGKQITVEAFDDPDEDAARKVVLGAFGSSGTISFFMSQRLGTHVVLRLVETGSPDATRLLVGGTAYDPSGPTILQQSAMQSRQNLCASEHGTGPACDALKQEGPKISQNSIHQLPVWSAEEGIGRDTGPTESEKTAAARQLAGDFAAYWYKVLRPASEGQAVPDNVASLLRSAEKGDAVAQKNLGVIYHNGQGVPQSDALAVTWSRKAAEQGNPDAENNLASAYYFGRGVAQDYTRSLYWYREAAEQGNSLAQNNLGEMYHNGRGVPQNYAQALYWFRKGAEKGYAPAQVNLGISYYHGQGVAQDYGDAYFWLALAASGKVDGGVKKEDVKKWRDDAASHLTPTEFSQMQERVRKWIDASPSIKQ